MRKRRALVALKVSRIGQTRAAADHDQFIFRLNRPNAARVPVHQRGQVGSTLGTGPIVIARRIAERQACCELSNTARFSSNSFSTAAGADV
jgi:hypothetical protein